jgi:glycerol kinase
MAEKYVLSLDQGTTSSRTILYDGAGRPLGSAQEEFPQIFPRPGWVEHDPVAIWESQIATARKVLADSGIHPRQIAAIGITNQRETTIVWERRTGRPVHNAIVWQCRRTVPMCEALKEEGFEREIRARTGLVCDAYFSGTKVKWLLENVPELRARAEKGEVLFGTVDSWLLYNLTGGRVHATDASNASRTLLYNIHEHRWDSEILAKLGIPEAMLPQVFPSSHGFGVTTPHLFSGEEIPITGVAGDQQAALFGQACFRPGMAKVTFGTGAFLLMNTGPKAIPSSRGLVTSIAWALGSEWTYCLEGSVFIAGAAIQWLRDGLSILSSSAESEVLARSVEDNGGVYLVPAFVGLGAPHWDGNARGLIIGLTRGTHRGHLARAALESMAYQVRDVIDCMRADSGLPVEEIRADGGAAQNELLLQFQADILQARVLRPTHVETTAQGAAYLAGLGAGLWRSAEEIAGLWALDRQHEPTMELDTAERFYAEWRRAVERARHWVCP